MSKANIFNNELQQTPPQEAPGFMTALRAWCDYYIACDQHDRIVCGNEEGRPRNPDQYRAIQEFSKTQLKLVQEKLANVNDTVTRSARITACRPSERDRLAIINSN